jgi:hypothetical protein
VVTTSSNAQTRWRGTLNYLKVQLSLGQTNSPVVSGFSPLVALPLAPFRLGGSLAQSPPIASASSPVSPLPQWPQGNQLPEVTVTATKCTSSPSNESFGDQVSDAIVGFGDAFLIPILVRNAFDIQGSVNYNSSAYTGGMIGGTIWGLAPFALEGAATYSAAQAARSTPSILNANRYFRIGPGVGWGGTAVPRISSPYLPGTGHYSLTTRLPPIPPLGALASGNGC